MTDSEDPNKSNLGDEVSKDPEVARLREELEEAERALARKGEAERIRGELEDAESRLEELLRELGEGQPDPQEEPVGDDPTDLDGQIDDADIEIPEKEETLEVAVESEAVQEDSIGEIADVEAAQVQGPPSDAERPSEPPVAKGHARSKVSAKAVGSLLSAALVVVLVAVFWPSGPSGGSDSESTGGTPIPVATTASTTTVPDEEPTKSAQGSEDKEASGSLSATSSQEQDKAAACLPSSDFQQLVRRWNSVSTELVVKLLDSSVSSSEYVQASERVTPQLENIVSSMAAKEVCDGGELMGLMPAVLETYQTKLSGYLSVEQGLRSDSDELFSKGWELLMAGRNEANAIACTLSPDSEPVPNFAVCAEQAETEIALRILQGRFEWKEQSSLIADLQILLGLNPDGTYGSATRAAHLDVLLALQLDTANVPEIPITVPTTQPAPPEPTAILTGLKITSENNRPALVVKIDNASAARPQFGINRADIVFEELIEGNQTRFTAVFQSQEAEQVGPIRSVRTGDFDLLRNLNRPLFAHSGGNAYTMSILQGIDLVDVGVDKVGYGTFFRVYDRYSPHNLMSSTGALRRHALGQGGAPPALLNFVDSRTDTPFLGTSTSRVQIGYGGITVDYKWNSGKAAWDRQQNGLPHVDSNGVQIAPANLVIQFVSYGQSAAYPFTPEPNLLGQGIAWVLSDGKLIKGSWARSSSEAATRYADGNGTEIRLTPGTTWVSLARTGSVQVYS